MSVLISACNSTVVNHTAVNHTTSNHKTNKPSITSANSESHISKPHAPKLQTPIQVSKKQATKKTPTENVKIEPSKIELSKIEPTKAIEPVGNLWLRIRDGFAFTDDRLKHPDAKKRIDLYRKRFTNSQKMVDRVTQNATPYLYFIVSELTKHDIPLELAILPIIESLYDPFAYSSGRASGLWQFIPGTGKRFGLTQDWWQDERRETIAATGSAIQYLLYLHKRFDNDWLLAMAAYNAGQGTVSRAIRKNRKKGKATDYWSLDLPKETKHYIPKLLAWRDLILTPNNYKVTLPPIADEAYFAIVDIGSQIDLAEAAKLAEVDIDTIYKLNPAYNRWATDPSPPHHLLVPVSQADILQNNLETLPHSQRMTWRRYIIKPNDSVSEIAKEFNTTPRLIARINGLKKNRIQAGKALLIPSASRESEYYRKSIDQRLAKQQQRASNKKTHRIEHTVRRGENLWDIAKKYNVNVKSLTRWNHIKPKSTLAINKKLVVWTNKSQSNRVNLGSSTNKETRKLFYKVKKGDSLTRIARRFQVNIGDIKNWNNINTQKYIKPGQLLTLYIALTDRQLITH